MSSTTALIVLVVVVIIAGAGAYGGLSSVPSSTTTKTTCTPASACVTSAHYDDVTMTIPFTIGYGETYSEIAVGTSIQASVGVTGTETIKTFAVTWGPGIATTGTTGALTYTYGTAGLYTLVANATDTKGLLHSGPGELVPLLVNPSAANITLGYFPTLSTSLTNSSGGPYGWIGAGGSVSVNASYSHPPTNTAWSTKAPSLVGPTGITPTKSSFGALYASATYTFPSAGYYGITFVGPTTNGVQTRYQNFTWGVYVGTSATGLGCALCKIPVAASPHKGTFYNYEVIPGGALSLDPAADYYSVGYEVGEGFDESLIALNGTDSGATWQNFVPEVATCVPGSPLCVKLYGSTLVQGNNFTFVIDKAAHFWDPYANSGAGAGREVYPTDVMFSIIRAIFYTQDEGITGYYVGFDIAGPLVPYVALSPGEVNPNWDIGPGNVAIHSPYNNTPYYTLSAFSVNDTQWCPTIAMSQENGCITFHADADGKAWPALLLILSIISADGIQEAGWYTAQGASVPGFDCSTVNVDLPCLLPGDTNSTNTTAYKTWVQDSLTGTSGADSPYGFDNEELADLGYPYPVPSITDREVGSGPYYLAYANSGVGYTLKVNPDYQAPTGCAGQPGCLPLPGHYVGTVINYWESTDQVGISEAEAGWADGVAFESPDYGTMLGLVQSGQLGLIDFPGLATDNYAFNTQIDLPLLATLDSSSSVGIDIPSNALSFVGLRATLEYAYPYATAQVLENVIDGIDTGSPFGGFLPPSESAYYNAQTPWPNYNNLSHTFSNPASGNGPGTPEWYWNQAYNVSTSQYYDPELQAFSASKPLYIPTLGFTSAPNINAAEVAWGRAVTLVTGGVVQFQQFFVPSTTEDFTYVSPGSVPWALWMVTWIPDYPAPVNNWQGAYGSGLWGGADSLYQTFGGVYPGPYNNYNDTAACGHYNPTVANMTYWALDQANNIIPQDCQGTAWNVTTYYVNAATYTLNTTLSVQLWALVQDAYNNMQISVGTTSLNIVFNYAPWIDPASINENVLIGGGIEWYYQALQGNGLY